MFNSEPEYRRLQKNYEGCRESNFVNRSCSLLSEEEPISGSSKYWRDRLARRRKERLYVLFILYFEKLFDLYTFTLFHFYESIVI